MSCLTKLFFHTGTTSPTDIGPASGGVLHSITASTLDGTRISVVLKDGGSSGTAICDVVAFGDQWQLRFNGAKLSGQLNITLSGSAAKVTVEMSQNL